MAAKIREIAERAGVSPATVSLVLNMRPGVGVETRDRVLETAAQLCYKPRRNGLPSGFLTRTIRFIRIAKHGRVVNSDNRVFVADYIDGIEREARQHGCTLVVSSFDRFAADEVLGFLDEGSVSGAVVLGTELDEADVEAFASARIPLVFMDTCHALPKFDFVDIDNDACVSEVVKYFRASGHSRIGIVKDGVGTRNFKLREASFSDALARSGSPLRDEDVFELVLQDEGGERALSRPLRKRTDMPTALFCVNDIAAYRFSRFAQRAGLAVPDDLSLVGFDDLPSSVFMTPPLTSVRVAGTRIGQRAMQLLALRIDDLTRPPEKVLVGGELVVRDSVRQLGGRTADPA